MRPGSFATVAIFLLASSASAQDGTGGGNWGSHYQVSNTGGHSSGSVGRGLTVDSRGHLHVLWTEVRGAQYDVLYARSTDGGASWSPGYDLSNSTLPAMGGNIAAGPDDTLHAAWTDRRQGGNLRIYYSRSINSGASWEAPRDISGDLGNAATPSISVDQRQRVHVAWHTGDADDDASPAAIVFYTHSLDGGATFTGVARLSAVTGQHAAWPRFSVAGTDGDVVAVAWRDNRRVTDWDIYAAVSTDGGSSFAERVVRADPTREWDPDTVVDPTGQIYVSYMRHVAHAIEIMLVRSRDFGRTWTAPVKLSEAHSRFPFFAPAWSAGVLALFWKDERDAGADIVGRFSFDGGVTWSAQEWVTDHATTETKFPSPALASDGRPHVTWSDQRLGETREAVFVRSRLAAPKP